MTRRQKIIIGSGIGVGLVVAAFFLLTHLQGVFDEHRKRMTLGSCTNHGNHIQSAMSSAVHSPRSNQSDWELPYLTNQPGYKVLVAHTLHQPGSLQCRHRNWKTRNGGWQFVNLSPKTWDHVFLRWKERHPNYNGNDWEIPLHWCGGPTGLPNRYVTVVSRPNKSSRKYAFSRAGMPEAALAKQLDKLNQILSELGQPAVAMDIPEDIDWLAVQSWASNAVQNLPNPISQQNHIRK